MTKIFFDCEFTGFHQNTTLISIGLISEGGNTFYAEFTDYDTIQVDEWIQTNLINNLVLDKFDYENGYEPYSKDVRFTGNTEDVAFTLDHWLHGFKQIEIWSDCLAYDWVLFNQLFGGALHVPEHLYYIPFDICTLFKIKGINPDIDRKAYNGMTKDTHKHNALWKAKVIKSCYERLIKL